MDVEAINKSLRQGRGRRELIVFLHGFRASSADVDGIAAAIREVKPDADILAPMMPYGDGPRGLWCRAEAAELVACMLRAIDQLDQERPYQEIIFTGHSFGAVLSRKIAVVAHGEKSEAPFEQPLKDFVGARLWAERITRIVLLAGMNRGWSISSAMDWLTTAKWAVGTLIGEFVLSGRLTILAIRQGAPFLVQGRLQWLALMRPRKGSKPTHFFIVQLLGNTDDQVSPDDNVDFAIDLVGGQHGTSYFYLEVPRTDHPSIIQMDELSAAEASRLDDKARAAEKEVRAKRRERFQTALTAPREKIAAESIPRDQLADSLPPKPNTHVTDVVFVIHGIRDKGFWTQKIAGAIKREAAVRDRQSADPRAPASQESGRHATPEGGTLRSFTGSYGYFAMAPFMFRPIRRRKVEWLMDRYAEMRARYPNARFSYVGHSNGTYLLADALCLYPSADFKRVIFAGSVVRRDFDWSRFLRPKEADSDHRFAERTSTRDDKSRKLPGVDEVLNYVATNDWVVALLPKAVQPLRFFDLGSAGFDGFADAEKKAGSVGDSQISIREIRYVKGEHSAGIKESQWGEIAKFIVHGTVPPQNNPDFDGVQNERLRRWSERSYWLFWVVLALVVLIGAGFFGWTLWALGPLGLIPALLLLVYYKFVKTIITRF
jgi:pimeloyl-ACP methyl ester carboxylesterase